MSEQLRNIAAEGEQKPEEFVAQQMGSEARQTDQNEMPTGEQLEKSMPDPAELENWSVDEIEHWIKSNSESSEKKLEFVKNFLDSIDVKKIDFWKTRTTNISVPINGSFMDMKNQAPPDRLKALEHYKKQQIIQSWIGIAPSVNLLFYSENVRSKSNSVTRDYLNLVVKREVEGQYVKERILKDFVLPLLSNHQASNFGNAIGKNVKSDQEPTTVSKFKKDLEIKYTSAGRKIKELK